MPVQHLLGSVPVVLRDCKQLWRYQCSAALYSFEADTLSLQSELEGSRRMMENARFMVLFLFHNNARVTRIPVPVPGTVHDFIYGRFMPPFTPTQRRNCHQGSCTVTQKYRFSSFIHPERLSGTEFQGRPSPSGLTQLPQLWTEDVTLESLQHVRGVQALRVTDPNYCLTVSLFLH